jgi:hypothetical protein
VVAAAESIGATAGVVSVPVAAAGAAVSVVSVFGLQAASVSTAAARAKRFMSYLLMGAVS